MLLALVIQGGKLMTRGNSKDWEDPQRLYGSFC